MGSYLRRIRNRKTAKSSKNQTPKVTPAAKTLAQEYGVDASLIIGTGKNQNVTVKDVRKYIEDQISAQEEEE